MEAATDQLDTDRETVEDGELEGFEDERSASSRQPRLETLDDVRRFQGWMVRRMRDGKLSAARAKELRRLVLDVKETIIAGRYLDAGLPAPGTAPPALPGQGAPGASTVVNFNTVVAPGGVSRIGELLAALAGARAAPGAPVLDEDRSVVPAEGGPGS